MTKFYENWRERPLKQEEPPETLEEILNWWENRAFDMPSWYDEDWEPSN